MQERETKVDQMRFSVKLDDLTLARLVELADNCHALPEAIIAAIVHDVLEDDALAHEQSGVMVH